MVSLGLRSRWCKAMKKRTIDLKIVPYTDEKEPIIALLEELQEHLVYVDAEKVQIMSDQYGEEYFCYLQQLLTDNGGVMYLAMSDDSVVGMIAGYIEPKDDEDRITNRCPKRGVISDLVVSSSLRNKGVGDSLMNAMENHFLSIGCEFIAVSVFAPNEVARRFYEKSGYAPRNIELYKRIGNQEASNAERV